jgi:hypothetical protein
MLPNFNLLPGNKEASIQNRICYLLILKLKIKKSDAGFARGTITDTRFEQYCFRTEGAAHLLGLGQPFFL